MKMMMLICAKEKEIFTFLSTEKDEIEEQTDGQSIPCWYITSACSNIFFSIDFDLCHSDIFHRTKQIISLTFFLALIKE